MVETSDLRRVEVHVCPTLARRRTGGVQSGRADGTGRERLAEGHVTEVLRGRTGRSTTLQTTNRLSLPPYGQPSIPPSIPPSVCPTVYLSLRMSNRPSLPLPHPSPLARKQNVLWCSKKAINGFQHRCMCVNLVGVHGLELQGTIWVTNLVTVTEGETQAELVTREDIFTILGYVGITHI